MNSYKVRKIILCAITCLILPLIRLNVLAAEEPASGAHGSGSYQLNEVKEDSRFYTEYYVEAASGKSITTADVLRRTSIKVYAKKGETILFGSSVSNSQIDENNTWIRSVTKKDIVITRPGGTKVSFDVLAPGEKDANGVKRTNGLGYIANPTQEENGPMVNHTDEVSGGGKYYTPLTYSAPEDGVYTFEFHSVTGYNNGKSPTPKKAKEAWVQSDITVAAWDVTVLGKGAGDKWEVKEGRAWADYLAITTGGGSAQSDLNVHVLSHDGYLYKVDFNKSAPFGFIFFANNTGFMKEESDGNGHTIKVPIYHSFYDDSNDLDHMSNEKILLHKPNEADTKTEETYKIFFNRPSSDLDAIEIKTKPDETVVITDLKFKGIDENIAQTGLGGTFTFNSSGEAMVSITLDLRKALFDSGFTIETYDGTGIVELTAPAVAGTNMFYWDGKDSEGKVIPAGIYGKNNVVLSSEVKRGELHFPVIDMEGLYGGLRVQRLNGNGIGSASDYNLYYNNNPLAYGNIEGKGFTRIIDGNFDVLSDGTKSYRIQSDRGGLGFFPNDNPEKISTLVKDDKDYLAHILYGVSSYSALDDAKKEIINAEFGKEHDTFHFNPVDSRTTSMYFKQKDYYGGGNQAGIDAWTYYSQGVQTRTISFAVMDKADSGIITGKIFYDKNRDTKFNVADGDYWLSNMKVRLIDASGNPVQHQETLPVFDETGHFMHDEHGNVKHDKKDIVFEAVTDQNGEYRFVGVPYDKTSGTKYFIQVMLTDVQSEVLRYTCTTSQTIKESLKTTSNFYFIKEIYTIDADIYGPDGNKIEYTTDPQKAYQYRYKRNTIADNETETEFDVADKAINKNTQYVTLGDSSITDENHIHTVSFKNIGYCTTLPDANRWDYTVNKIWGKDYKGDDTHKISDGIIVELYVWNDAAVKEENALELSRRTGALMDTQILNEENHWSYTWHDLDDRLQYYVLEYYIKKKPNGEEILDDKEEPRKVLIGGTMPIFSDTTNHPGDKYGFATNLGAYPEVKEDLMHSGTYYIPIQTFSDIRTHANSITSREKLEAVDNNARQYNVTYKLSKNDVTKTNTIDLSNSQMFDDRTYYVWLNHETELPDMIGETYVDVVDGKRITDKHAVTLQRDKLVENGEYSIKGLSVTSLDAASSDNKEGNATSAFRIKEDGTSALFTANTNIYTTGTGTRTYLVKYVVEAGDHNKPVSVNVNAGNKLVLANDASIEVESNPLYTVYSWYMTIHVYDVNPDGTIEYTPADASKTLQSALDSGQKLTWTKTSLGPNSIEYKPDNIREGILKNDVLRVPLYKDAVEPHMGTCADVVAIAYAGSSVLTNEEDIKGLDWSDTFASQYGNKTNSDGFGLTDGKAVAQGHGGDLIVELNTHRITRIDRIQDHANYANVTFKPKNPGLARTIWNNEDVFYYKVVVFAEDNTYQFSKYDEIDASSGVVMYSYFTMKLNGIWPAPTPEPIIPPDDIPIYDPDPEPILPPGNDPDTDPIAPPGRNPNTNPDIDDYIGPLYDPMHINKPNIKDDEKRKDLSIAPNSGQESFPMLMFYLVGALVCLIAISGYVKRKNTRS